MADKLREFAEKLATDADLLDKFRTDKAGTMTDHGLSEDDQQLVLDGNVEELKKRVGEDLVSVKPILTYHSQ